MIPRAARLADAAAVRAVVTAAFGQPAEAGLVEALGASGDALIDLVAEADADGALATLATRDGPITHAPPFLALV